MAEGHPKNDQINREDFKYVFGVDRPWGDTPMTDKLREKIADHFMAYSYWLTSHYESVGQNVLEADRRAKAILAIQEIKEGLELREKAQSGNLVELDENQSYPDYDWLSPDEKARVAFVHKADWAAGFRRVKVKG